MLWLFTQVWIWIIVALLLGVLAGWWFWARPVRRAADALESGSAGRAGDRLTTPAPAPAPFPGGRSSCPGSTPRRGSGT